MAVVQENRYLLVLPRRAYQKVQEAIAVQIAGDDLQSAGGRYDSQTLRCSSRQNQADGVSKVPGGRAILHLHGGQVRLAIAVKIRNRKISVRCGAQASAVVCTCASGICGACKTQRNSQCRKPSGPRLA